MIMDEATNDNKQYINSCLIINEQKRRKHVEELLSVTDEDGKTYRFVLYRGVSVPPFPNVRQHMADLVDNFTARHDDVLICAFVKSGTHWVNEMAHMIMRKTLERPPPKEEFMLERVDRSQIEKLSSRRLLNTHTRFSHLPASIFDKAKVIFITRDLRDVAVSLYHHISGREVNHPAYYKPSWSAYLKLFYSGLIENGAWYEYINDWHENWLSKGGNGSNTLMLNYEQMKMQPRQTLLNLSKFLLTADKSGQLNDNFIESVLHKTGFDSMKSDRGKDSAIAMYRKGVVGDWKNQFSELDHSQFKSQLFDYLPSEDKKIFLKYSGTPDWSVGVN